MMTPTGGSNKNITKRIRLLLSFDPPKFIEGTITIPGPKIRLSDVVNDDRTFLSIQDVWDPNDWFHESPIFLLLNKWEIKAIIEVE
jgi:hypothetical protein